jgi:hypothetical protein
VEKYPRYQWIEGWVDPRADLEAVVKRKNLCPAGNLVPVVEPVVQITTD